MLIKILLHRTFFEVCSGLFSRAFQIIWLLFWHIPGYEADIFMVCFLIHEQTLSVIIMSTILRYPTWNFICHFISSCPWSQCFSAALHSQLLILIPAITVMESAVSVLPLFITFSRSFKTLLSSTDPGKKSQRIVLVISFQWENCIPTFFFIFFNCLFIQMNSVFLAYETSF